MPRWENLTQKDVSNIISRYTTESISIEKLSVEIGVGKDRITKILKRNNIKLGHEKHNEQLYELYDNATDTYLETKSIVQTCKIHSISTEKNFREYLKSKGIDVINYQNLPNCNINKFQTIDNEEKAYWLGFLYADGHVDSGDKQLQLALKEDDYDHIVKFKEFMDCTNKITFKEYHKGNSYRISMGSQKLGNDLINNGCTQRKSLTLTFPNKDILNDELLRHFIRGYFDGDGHLGIRYTKKLIPRPRGAIVGTKQFITTLCERMNMPCRFDKIRSQGKAYQYEFILSDLEILLPFMYENCSIYLDRKYEKYLELRLYLNLPSFTVM